MLCFVLGVNIANIRRSFDFTKLKALKNEVRNVHVSCADVAVRVLLFTALQITSVLAINENVFEMFRHKEGCRLPVPARTSIQSIKKGYSRMGIDSLISLDTTLPIGHKKALLL